MEECRKAVRCYTKKGLGERICPDWGNSSKQLKAKAYALAFGKAASAA